MRTKMAKELPRHKSYPRYIAIATKFASIFGGKPKMSVRLTCRRFITPQRWNELAQQCETFDEQFETAKRESNEIEAAAKIEYAGVLRQLAEIDAEQFGDSTLLHSRQLKVAEYNARKK